MIIPLPNSRLAGVCRVHSPIFLLYFFMAQDYAKTFYKSKAWKQTRDLYAKSVGGLCEICWQNGLVVPGEIVHHRIHLTPENISNPEIALKFSNLQLVCRDCHAMLHKDEGEKRYRVDPDGSVVIR